MRLGFGLLVVLAACGTDNPRPEDSKPSVAPPSLPATPPLNDDDIPECDVPTTYVYVISEDSHLYRFEPDKLLFTEIGHVLCPTAETPFSMAVDRHGKAWVNYHKGAIFRVSTRTAECTPTTFTPGFTGFVEFGMGFATDGDSTSETLYVAGVTPAAGFGKIDLTSMTLTPVGDFTNPLSGQWAELTGTAGGFLFGYFPLDDRTLIAQIGPDTGASTILRELTHGPLLTDAWAFTFWGGDFWFYNATDTKTSSVSRLRTATDGGFQVVIPDTQIRIVGAGVSTCAPRVPVR